jgi:TonB family protein
VSNSFKEIMMLGNAPVIVLLAISSFVDSGQVQGLATPPSTCAQALAAGTGPAVAELCLGDEALQQALRAKDAGERRRLLQRAVEHYRKGASLAAENDRKLAALEALARVYAHGNLDEYDSLESTLREIVDLRPGELDPVFRLAKAQEDHAFIEAAEETLLTARRQHPDQPEAFKMLAQFYARRATALHTEKTADARQPASAPGEPDEHGIYRVGGGVTPPARLDRPVYPPEAQAAGIKGVVIAEVVIDPAGDVVDARIMRSIPMLDEAALQAVRNWHFQPTIMNGQPVPVRMTVTVNFDTR